MGTPGTCRAGDAAKPRFQPIVTDADAKRGADFVVGLAGTTEQPGAGDRSLAVGHHASTVPRAADGIRPLSTSRQRMPLSTVTVTVAVTPESTVTCALADVPRPPTIRATIV